MTDSVGKSGCEICKCRQAARNQRSCAAYFAVYITAIIMMLITILLMIEDRCNTSFATTKMLAIVIVIGGFSICFIGYTYTGSIIVELPYWGGYLEGS